MQAFGTDCLQTPKQKPGSCAEEARFLSGRSKAAVHPFLRPVPAERTLKLHTADKKAGDICIFFQ